LEQRVFSPIKFSKLIFNDFWNTWSDALCANIRS